MLTLLLSVSSIYAVISKEDTTPRHHNKPHPNGVKADYTGAISAHDLWQDFGEEWGGSSTLPDGSDNPNKIVGWGSAASDAWTSGAKPAVPQPQPQIPYGYTPGYGYSTGYQQPGFGYSPAYGYNPVPGYPQSPYGYTGAAYGQMPGAVGMPMGRPMPGAIPGAIPGAVPVGFPAIPGAPLPGTVPGGLPGVSGVPLPGMPGVPLPEEGDEASTKCPLPKRHRKPWALLTQEQKNLFIDGFQQVRKNGKLDIFAQTHAQHDLLNYVHYTSLFTFYHAYMVWELETAIRDLGGEFACFTMPYYDWTLDAGKEDDPEILKSGLGGDGDRDNLYCVMDDDTGSKWETCSDYSAWRDVAPDAKNAGIPPQAKSADTEPETESDTKPDAESADDVSPDAESADVDVEAVESADTQVHAKRVDVETDDEEETADVEAEAETEEETADVEAKAQSAEAEEEAEAQSVVEEAEVETDNVDVSPGASRRLIEEHPGPVYIHYDDAYDDAEVSVEDEEQCYWTQANCRQIENAPFCCLKRKKSETVLLPTAAEVGNAIYSAKNIKEFQGYLNEYFNKLSVLFGADYFAQMANGYATEDPIFWLSMSFMVHLRSLWQDCWNYNNIPKDKLDMHYNSYHPYCGTTEISPTSCAQYNLGLDAPMNFFELQQEEWTLAAHKIVTVRMMWAPEYWNVVYELGPFYKESGINNWCDNTRDSEWFIETMDYNADIVHTPVNAFSQGLRELMIKDSVEPSGVYQTVAALSCQYNRLNSGNSCFDEDEWLELQDSKETCDEDEEDPSDTEELESSTLDEFIDMDGVRTNKCLRRIRTDVFPYADHSVQVKKQLCKGEWDYPCPVYNDLLYGQYKAALTTPFGAEKSNAAKAQSYFAKTGWIWIIVINAILVVIVAIGCGIWHCSRSKTGKFQLLGDDCDGVVVDEEDDEDGVDHHKDANKIQPIQENEEYQPLLV